MGSGRSAACDFWRYYTCLTYFAKSDKLPFSDSKVS